MPAPISQKVGPVFGAHDYEIVFLPLTAPHVAHIRATAAEPLRVGDLYTLGQAGVVYDLVVQDITRPKGGGWNARCRVSALS